MQEDVGVVDRVNIFLKIYSLDAPNVISQEEKDYRDKYATDIPAGVAKSESWHNLICTMSYCTRQKAFVNQSFLSRPINNTVRLTIEMILDMTSSRHLGVYEKEKYCIFCYYDGSLFSERKSWKEVFKKVTTVCNSVTALGK